MCSAMSLPEGRNSMFTEMITFQVKPDQLEVFEALAAQMKAEQTRQPGCMGIRYFKRFYTFDGVENGQPPRELTRIVKCVKYYAYWEFDNVENCGRATGWLFETWYKPIAKLLIMPFELNSGYAL